MKIIDAHAHLVQCIAGTCGGGEMRACGGGRSCADSARGTHPSGLPFSAAAGIGMAIIVAAPCPARQTDGGQGG